MVEIYNRENQGCCCVDSMTTALKECINEMYDEMCDATGLPPNENNLHQLSCTFLSSNCCNYVAFDIFLSFFFTAKHGF